MILQVRGPEWHLGTSSRSAGVFNSKYNNQNIKMKFDGMKFKMNFKETPRNITNIWVLTKAKAFLEKY